MKSNSVQLFFGTPDSSSLKALVDGNYRVEMLYTFIRRKGPFIFYTRVGTEEIWDG